MFHLHDIQTATLRPWVDPPGGRGGVSPRSGYVDRFWLPVLGPTATCLVRLLAHSVRGATDPVVVSKLDLASGLGLEADVANLELDRAFRRLLAAGLVTGDDANPLLIRTELPYLQPAQVDLLAPDLAAAHRVVLDACESVRAAVPQPPLVTRLLHITGAVEEVLADPELDPRQLAHSWQHIVRLSTDARDEALLEWAPPDLEVAIAEGQLAGQAFNEAAWSAHHRLAEQGHLPRDARQVLCESAAAMIDWMVTELPLDDDTWDGLAGWGRGGA